MSEIHRSSTAAPALDDERAAPIAPEDRPAASGHRFGPDLACSECGVQWETHQRAPTPCESEAPDDVFLRRPAVADGDDADDVSS